MAHAGIGTRKRQERDKKETRKRQEIGTRKRNKKERNRHKKETDSCVRVRQHARSARFDVYGVDSLNTRHEFESYDVD